MIREPWFAVRRAYTVKPLFGAKAKPREYVEHLVVQANSVDAAVAHAVSRASVGAINAGLTVDVAVVDWSQSERFTAKYDGPPMLDNHASTGAKLVVSRAANSQEPTA